MLFVVYAIDKKDIMPTRAKHYRAHRIHLDKSEDHAVDVVTAGTLLADDGENSSRQRVRRRRQRPSSSRRLRPQ